MVMHHMTFMNTLSEFHSSAIAFDVLVCVKIKIIYRKTIIFAKKSKISFSRYVLYICKTSIYMKTVAFVPIKLNSQRVPHKNILPLGRHALCWYIFETLLKLDGVDDVYVYCSDKSVMDYLPEGVTFLQRDAYLDGDKVKGFEIYERFIRDVDADVYLLSHATSPFVRPETVQKALDMVRSGKHDSAFAAERIQNFLWEASGPLNYDPNDVPRTQDLKPVYSENGAFYIFRKEVFIELHRRIGMNPFIGELDRVESVDIDEPRDMEFARMIAQARNI